MEIYISEEAVIANIQSDFQEIYPFLQLAFYQQPHEVGEACCPQEKIPPETPIEDIRIMHTFGWLDVSKHRTAAEIEHDFRHRMGLSVQVLHKSGEMWVQTTKTDYWTLQQLNEEGKLAEQHIFFYPEEPAE
ncbi:hypothetical protein SAMN05518672_103468 [Chitinophaga sp. CF118]|uniref:hypothetical protein n=1 Tax=Chitinophaga sp. CF118 TaxID=1884367 RepID=UPI0008EF2920|nr:hypothetical protein [Chitinophaga sp. CF118]SFD84270.1 hypothetical protein SAMN05518672_103468 [Chitinophaga sp. CF118]